MALAGPRYVALFVGDVFPATTDGVGVNSGDEGGAIG